MFNNRQFQKREQTKLGFVNKVLKVLIDCFSNLTSNNNNQFQLY